VAAASRPPGGFASAGRRVGALPPASFFVVSAIFHYLGPSFAVLLFAHLNVLGVAWLRIASAAVLFAVWRRPWRLIARCTGKQRSVLLALGVVLAAMNSLFSASTAVSGIDQLGAAMLIAALVATPFGIGGAAPAFVHPSWLLWGIAVGLCSSVIPYVADQLAMARVRRSTFALMLAILPATATVIGLLVLGQVPTVQDLLGIALVIAGVALHQDREQGGRRA